MHPVGIVGGPGCGKTTLITATIHSLVPSSRRCHRLRHRLNVETPKRISTVSSQVVQVNTYEARCSIDATYIRDALNWLDLKALDLLLIEHVGNLTRPPPTSARTSSSPCSVSPPATTKPTNTPSSSRLRSVILNKLDLLTAVPFNLNAFHHDIQHASSPGALYRALRFQARRQIQNAVGSLARLPCPVRDFPGPETGSDEPSNAYASPANNRGVM